MSKRQREGADAPAKRAAKHRIKKLVRTVILNMQWLNDSNEDTGISLNVKKNVANLVRQKRKVGMMTMAEKAMLRTPHHMRTVEDRKKLCNIMVNLACFSKFPPKVRARLVPHVIFMSVTPGRLIMKEGDFPVTMYFIIAGEVEMTRTVFNKLTKTYEVNSEAIFGPGDCIGDIDVLEDVARTSSYVATTNCELLAVFYLHYKLIFLPLMHKLWQEKKTALQALDYFNFFNAEQIVSASKYGTIQQFDPLETIYTEDLGSMSLVYFVLSGECVVLQCLHMKVNTVNRQKVFELVSVKGYLSSTDNTKVRHEPVFDVNEYMQSTSSLDENKEKKTQSLRKMGLSEIQRACADMKRPANRRSTARRTVRQRARSTIQRIPELERAMSWDDYDLYLSAEAEDDSDSYDDSPELRYSEMSNAMSPPHFTETSEPVVESETEGSEIFTASTTSLKLNDKAAVNLEHFETHFIDVGSLTYGGIFGLGEKMAHRVIMARTTVQCLVIPRFWLFDSPQNPGNIWQRQRFYIDCNIPTREALFKDFLKTRKWEKFRHDYIQSILDAESLSNFTKLEDIPIINRIVETKCEDS